MTNTRRVKPVLRWPGSKTRLLPKLLPLIPEHVCYVECFGGSLALLMAKERSPVEIVNDLNGDIIALYRNVQYHLPELIREIDYILSSRKNLHDFVAQPGLTEIQRAARFLARNKTCFGGNMETFGVTKTRGGGINFCHEKQAAILGEAHKRLNGVVIENVSYERLFKLYDSKESFFFLDPPYLDSKVQAYQGWTRQDLTQFKRKVEKLTGRWVVTLDGSQFNKDLFSDCQIEVVSSRNQAVNVRTHGQQKFEEIIITPK